MNERSIFCAALDIADPAQRSGYLDEACGEDAALRRQVEKLFRHHQEPDSLLENPDGFLHMLESQQPLQAPHSADAESESPGTKIGPYKLLEQIGEGGMGVVYMAHQERPLRRKVALKLIKPGMDSRQVLARFEAERQALALMEHPNIARILDAGMIPLRNADCGLRIDETASDSNPQSAIRNPQFPGRPYFVMELVRGIPITEFCDKSRRSIRQRLELFATVCRAVQHAHQKGIIHRDLKPTNILVTLHDGTPVPKVIDFGVAKAVHEPLTERTLHTGFCQMLGTPAYMSPEQAALSGLDIDTRSDVYSLGVLLYELLTGSPPFDHDTLKKAGYDEFRRLVREVEPPIPNSRLSTLNAEAISTVADHRASEPRKLGQLLLGELDWLVMKALEKDRNRRYESASAFAGDVERYLKDEPVEACPPSVGYRTRKFLRRHKGPVAAAAVVVLSLIGGITVATWQAVRATAAQKQSSFNEQKAATEAAIARAVNDFLQNDLLRQVDIRAHLDEGFRPDRNLTVREALDRAAAKIGERFRDQPLVEAAIRTTIGEAYATVGELRRRVTHLERALELRQAALAPEHPDTIGTKVALAVAYGWVGRFAEAVVLHQQTFDTHEALLGPDHLTTLTSLMSLAHMYRAAGQWNKAIPLAEQGVEKCKATHGTSHPTTIGFMHQLAFTYADADRLDESLALHEETLLLSRATNHDGTIFVMETYTRAFQKAGKLDEADRLIRQALELARKEDPSGATQRVAHVLAAFGLNLILQNRHVEAEPVAREALAIYQNRPDDWRRFHAMSLVGGALLGRKKYTDAEPFLLQGYEGMTQGALGAGGRFWIGLAGDRVVRLYDETNQPQKARAWREKLQETKKQ